MALITNVLVRIINALFPAVLFTTSAWYSYRREKRLMQLEAIHGKPSSLIPELEKAFMDCSKAMQNLRREVACRGTRPEKLLYDSSVRSVAKAHRAIDNLINNLTELTESDEAQQGPSAD